MHFESNQTFTSQHLQRRFGVRAGGLSPSLLTGSNNSSSSVPCSQCKLFMTMPFVNEVVRGTNNQAFIIELNEINAFLAFSLSQKRYIGIVTVGRRRIVNSC